MSKTSIERVFVNMKKRCYNAKDPRFKYYGAKGIKICREWLDDRSVFFAWALANGYRRGLTIERMEISGDYEPKNCRWATQAEQTRNTSRNRLITWRGQTKIVKEWEREYGFVRGWLYDVCSRGDDPAAAMDRVWGLG